MKNIFILLLLITVTRYYAQNESAILQYNGFLKVENSTIKFINSTYRNNLEKIPFFKPCFIENNSDGKFLKYSFNNETMLMLVGTSMNELNTATNKSLVLILKKDFVKKTTQKFLDEETIKNKLNKEYFKYDKSAVLDKLNKTIYDKEVTIQIGKSITKYLNKLHKSDLDKTFANELNLLVFSF